MFDLGLCITTTCGGHLGVQPARAVVMVCWGTCVFVPVITCDKATTTIRSFKNQEITV